MSFPVEESDFAALVRREVAKARAKHPALPTIHHGVSVILEEFLEMQAEAYAQQVNHFKLLKELTHVAATCERMAAELRLTDLVSVNEYAQAYAMAATGADYSCWEEAMLQGWFGYAGAKVADTAERMARCRSILRDKVPVSAVVVVAAESWPPGSQSYTATKIFGPPRVDALFAFRDGYGLIASRYRFLVYADDGSFAKQIGDPAEILWT